MNELDKPDPKRIRRIAESIIGLPTLPTVVSKMLELVDNPRTSTAVLARLVSTDQSLTARILKMANSAYYGFPREISTVNMAIVVMGFNAVKDMGLSLSVFDVFKDASGVQNFDITRFWEHSIGCGVAAKTIARRCRHSIAGEAFVAGLLHDIGKVVLSQYMRKEFDDIMQHVANGGSIDEAEMDLVGASHGEIGSWLAEKWRLPVMISQSIRFHHSPWECREHAVLVAIVSVANYLCHKNNIGASGRPDTPVIDEKTWNIFRENKIAFEEVDLENMSSEFLMELDKSDMFTSLFQSDDGTSVQET
jgi:HD-like signal output (HDOD) protein